MLGLLLQSQSEHSSLSSTSVRTAYQPEGVSSTHTTSPAELVTQVYAGPFKPLDGFMAVFPDVLDTLHTLPLSLHLRPLPTTEECLLPAGLGKGILT